MRNHLVLTEDLLVKAKHHKKITSSIYKALLIKKQDVLLVNWCKAAQDRLLLESSITKPFINILKKKELFVSETKFKLDLEELGKISGLLNTMILYQILLLSEKLWETGFLLLQSFVLKKLQSHFKIEKWNILILMEEIH